MSKSKTGVAKMLKNLEKGNTYTARQLQRIAGYPSVNSVYGVLSYQRLHCGVNVVNENGRYSLNA